MVEDAISFWSDIQRYENMLAADPKSYCFAPLSELYRKLGLLDDAISVAQKGCAQHPDYAGGFFALGAAYFAKGMKSEARAALERVVALKPDHLQALKLLGQLFVETGQIDLARSALGRILAADPEDTESALLLRSIAAPAAQQEEPIEELELVEDLEELEAVEEAPQDSGLGEVARALAGYEWGTSAAAAPEPVRAATAVGEPEDLWAIEATDELEDPWAVAAAEPEESFTQETPRQAPAAQAAAPQPSRDPLTTATLAELYVSQGFTEKAAGVYRELLAADPDNEGYRARYAELTRTVQAEAVPVVEPAPAAVVPAAETPAMAAAGQDLESQLQTWLDNIRRRRDGV